MKPHYLHPLFAPSHVAVVGASDTSGSAGQILLGNLLAGGFKGKITPVNIRHGMVGGLKAYAHLSEIPDPVDVAIVLTRISSLEAIFKDCAKSKIKFAVLLKTHNQTTAKDRKLLEKAVKTAKKLGVRVLGPSFLGMMRPAVGLNAGIHNGTVKAGNLALVSQSSALCSAMLDWAESRDIGFSTVLSLGEYTWDVDFGEILDYLVNDRSTQAILLHIHHAGNGRHFMSALRSAARSKPVVVIKSGNANGHLAGYTLASRRLSAGHVFDSALARAGVLQVRTMSEMFTAVRVLAANYRSSGDRLAVVCNGVGLGLLAADTAADAGVPLAQLGERTLAALAAGLPENWPQTNPVDILGDAGPMRFRTAVKLCLEDENTDAVLVLFSPQNGTDHLTTAKMMIQLQSETQKPILLSWLGGTKVQSSRDLFVQSKRVHFSSPEQAMAVFRKLADYNHNQRLLLQTPPPLNDTHLRPDLPAAHRLLDWVAKSGQHIAPEHISKQLLGLFGIHTNPTRLALNEEMACEIAEEMGYPVVLKIDSPDLFYKSDIDGVRLNLANREELVAAYRQVLANAEAVEPKIRINGLTVQPMYAAKHGREVSVSVANDAVFGPILTLGAGGDSADIQGKLAVSLPPLNDTLISDMFARAEVGKTFGSYRNMPPIDDLALRHLLLRVSEIVCELPEIAEIEIDPIIVGPEGIMVLDARMVLRQQEAPVARYGHMAIMPYPHFLETETTLKDGTAVFVRPLRPEDADMVQAFVRGLSDESRYNRFMSSIKQLSQNVLVRFTQLDYDREMALVMLKRHPDGHEEILSIARYITDPDMTTCEFGISVSDQWQGHGIGVIMMNLLFDAARHQGLKTMRGEILTANTGMQKLTRKLGFNIKKDPDDTSICLVERPLVEKTEQAGKA
ncbi:bifunctional acetate--CoA ligase family protein/GNAT family N-acetyltransferase [Neisseria shayeganii]|uniref:GNAT family acetyltransferase n=1 Tax=Neisseria shayeganii 871 TaxID=1032488 RepID=G4CFF9_9NEIS|nr:bifunctional acetate--CoA ligase family protein/GNAT family N-acetyltransferase [Neisseria shayeganii]EGY53423.1 GNAT family acetyltransferase [Neisseria shayeganii 871]